MMFMHSLLRSIAPNTRLLRLLLTVFVGAARLQTSAAPDHDFIIAPGQWRSFAREGFPDLFAWSDTCNVYVLRDGDAALLIDLGDGGVLEHLGEIGVRRVEWVLFTHHHREQCQGYPRLTNWNAKIAGPEAERALFERPASFRKIKPSLTDQYTVHSASYVRPPIQPIHLDRGFGRMDTFAWHSNEFRCQETKGNSPGGMTYLLQSRDRWLAFSGDVMCDGARMHNYFDTEWDYSFGAGIYALHDAAAWVAGYDPFLLLPSHGPVIRDARRQLETYQRKLERLEQMVLRGYSISRFAGSDQDRVSRPTAVPNIWQVSRYRQQVIKLWRKWLERRTRAERLTWARFNVFLLRHPLPRAMIVHRYAAAANLST